MSKTSKTSPKKPGRAPRGASVTAASIDGIIHDVEEEVARLRAALRTAERKNREYFGLIESVCKDRDRWKEMFFTVSIEHSAAQGMLVARIGGYGSALVTAVRALNDTRTRHGEEPIKLKVTQTDGREIWRRFDDIVADLTKHAPAGFDAAAERDKIAEGGEYQ